MGKMKSSKSQGSLLTGTSPTSIIETVLQQKPDHNVYLYGSVESAYDSSRPGADVADQAPFIVAITLPNSRVPTRLIGRVK